MTFTINFEKLKKQISNLDKLAIEQKWELSYDSDADSLYYSPKPLKNEYSLYTLSDDFSIFVDKNSNLGGIFIEYYQSNLVSHAQQFKVFKNRFIGNKKHKPTKDEKLLFTEVLKAEMLTDIVNDSKSGKIVLPA